MNNEEKILDILALMQTDMRSIHEELGSMHGEIGSMRGELGSMHGEIGSMRGEIGSMRDEITKINVKIENVIEPQIQALVEGQKTMLATLAPRAKMDELDDGVKFLEAVVPEMNKDIKALKKAR